MYMYLIYSLIVNIIGRFAQNGAIQYHILNWKIIRYCPEYGGDLFLVMLSKYQRHEKTTTVIAQAIALLFYVVLT